MFGVFHVVLAAMKCYFLFTAEVSEERISQSQRSGGTYNIYGQSGAMIWFKSLRKRIPISSSLAVSFLACHLAREPILPTDIYKWALEEKLPYLKAFLDIERQFGRPSSACPYSPSVMFKPYKVVGPRELEFMSGFVAQTIGLELPPVNFFAIANRYLNELSLPPDKILPLAARIYEWSMPPDLWLSANQKRLPSRVCVMSIILLAIRLLYNINGFGKWEESFAGPTISQSNQGRDGNIEVCSLSSDIPEKKISTCKSKKRKNVSRERSRSFDPNGKPKKRKNTVWSSRSSSLPGKRNPNKIRGLLNNHNYGFDTAELLHNLEALLANIDDKEEYLKDLPTYLKYCQDVVFAGLKPLLEINEEERIIEKLWNFYERQEDTPRRDRSTSIGDGGRTCRTPAYDGTCSSSMQCSQDEDSDSSIQKNDQILRGTAVKRLKMNMEENGFCYIPPRVKLKRLDHLHYIRKNDNGTRSYVAHADYYILLRACARVAEVGARYMHSGALKLEKRLCWIENRVDESLHFRFQKPSSQSTVDIDSVKDTNDDINNLNFNIVL
ncbi:hypothetical protein IFM89_016835 [Coptis chinensis]|uniref:TATA box-binding protein-associated factor RNA polymerase I subunit B n=1 Tax=Coptis chinensis TaxID=261450 RepID=A0A835GZ96_9MAGN|nr:hypothetical protein IFM89_016835 [Coptis chinensis]